MEVPRIVKDSLAIESLLEQRDELAAHLVKMTGERNHWRKNADGWCKIALYHRDERDATRADLADAKIDNFAAGHIQLLGERARLRAVVEAVEFTSIKEFYVVCPWCHKVHKPELKALTDPHYPDCERQAALSPPGPLSTDAGNEQRSDG